MSPATAKMMAEMVAYARTGGEVIPAFWQPNRGTSNTVSAAIRAAKTRGLLVQAGVDGCGNPKYAAPIPTATHASPETAQ